MTAHPSSPAPALPPARSHAAALDAGWIHIVPKGELFNAEADVVQVLDDPALASILSHLETDRARLGARWPGLYAGREHFVYDEEQDSAALAWFKDFEIRADGLWASADGLTRAGREAVQDQRYKFTSFVARREDLQPLGGRRHRVMRIDTVGFTNQANGKDLLAPISNRRPNAAPSLHGAVMSGVHPGHAANRLGAIARHFSQADRCSWEMAWRRACMENPSLSATAGQSLPRAEMVANRAPVLADAESRTCWQIAEGVEDAVRARLASPVVITRQGTALPLFENLLADARSRLGFTLEEAWLHVKAHHPQIFGQAMLETPEAERYPIGVHH